jgi:hypothetical protein
MAIERQLKRLRKGVGYWNKWRERCLVEVKVTDVLGEEGWVVKQV